MHEILAYLSVTSVGVGFHAMLLTCCKLIQGIPQIFFEKEEQEEGQEEEEKFLHSNCASIFKFFPSSVKYLL